MLGDITGTDTTNSETLVVSYTVKELLASLNESVTRIELKLDSKADAEVVERLTDRVVELELTKARVYGMAAAVGFITGGSGVVFTRLFL